MSKFPSYINEMTLRDVVVSSVKDKCGKCEYSLTITHRDIHGREWYQVYYNKMKTRNDWLFENIDDAVNHVLEIVGARWTPNVHSCHNLMMTSPTNKEREAIMRVWNEWQDKHKESENE